jgi:hypothetical protein
MTSSAPEMNQQSRLFFLGGSWAYTYFYMVNLIVYNTRHNTFPYMLLDIYERLDNA